MSVTTEKHSFQAEVQEVLNLVTHSLYSHKEIFLRELISNAVDATTKLRTLSSKGEFMGELGDLTIHIKLDKEAGTLTISDRGIGMDAEEVMKYLNQVAFSSARDFLEKYKANIEKAAGIRVFNTGRSGSLLPEVSYAYWSGAAI